MYTSIDDQAVPDEEVWRVWEQRRKLRQEKTVRKIKAAAASILVLLALGSAFYLLAFR